MRNLYQFQKYDFPTLTVLHKTTEDMHKIGARTNFSAANCLIFSKIQVNQEIWAEKMFALRNYNRAEGVTTSNLL